MKLLAPVSKLDSAIKQIKAGAGEIYLGGDTSAFNNFSFSGRGKYNPKMEKICPDIVELKEIVKLAHENKVTVMYTANIPFLADDVNGQEYVKHFLKYVEDGVKAGIDSIVVADIGVILLLREIGLNTHITASTFFETTNKDQILFLKELEVNRVVLSYQVIMAEIEELSKIEGVELEVFGHYGCSFYDGYCNLKHFFGETVKSGIGVPCQNVYKLIRDGEVVCESPVLRYSLVCSICSLIKLKRLGVHALKLVGRTNNADQNAEITSVYAKMLKAIDDNYSIEQDENAFIQDLKSEYLPRWWIQSICRQDLCKYKSNSVTNYFVGLTPDGKGGF